MLQSESIANLTAALIQAKAEFKPFSKGKTVRTGSYSYSYADLETVNASVEEALHNHGLVIIQQSDYRDGRDVLITTLAHESGEYVQGVLSLPVRKEADHQERGSAITYTRRYAISAILNLTADEDDDGASTNRPKQEKAKASKAGKAATREDVEEIFSVNRGISDEQVETVKQEVERNLPGKNPVEVMKEVVSRDINHLAEMTDAEARAVIIAARRAGKANKGE